MVKKEEENFRNYYDIIGDPIGIGGFGKIYKAKEKKSNEYRAIKVIDINKIKKDLLSNNLCRVTDDEIKKYEISFENEIKFMKIVSNNGQNINSVKYYEYFKTEGEFAFVMELCDDNLTKLFENKKVDEGLNIDEIYNILNQLNNSFKIMIENNIVHRDLKLENILLKYEKEEKTKYIVKLTDYGISRQLLNITHLSTKIGTPNYSAPEILEGNHNYNEECDLWSLGVIIYRLYFIKFPYYSETQIGKLDLIKNGILKKTGNKKLDDLIKKLLTRNPKERITWKEYFNHSFFKIRTNITNEKHNLINIMLKIEKKDINKDIYFLDNTNGEYLIDGEWIFNNHDNLKELNESNVELYIDNKNFKYKKFFNPEKEGLYEIKLIIKIDITDCSFMFYDCENITNLDLSSFDTKNVTNMRLMFFGCKNLSNLDLSSFDTNNTIDMKGMFSCCENLTNLNLSSFNTKNVSDMSEMFYNCKNITNLNLSSFDTKNTEDMNQMFYNCKNIRDLNLSSFDTKNVTNMCRMFFSCENITNLNLSNFDTQNVTDMSDMFSCCENIIDLNLSSFDTINVTYMSDMFSHCESITNINLSSFNTKNITDMSEMFYYCKNISNLNLSSFDTKNVIHLSNMFKFCNKLKSIKIKKDMKNLLNEILNEHETIEIIQI